MNQMACLDLASLQQQSSPGLVAWSKRLGPAFVKQHKFVLGAIMLTTRSIITGGLLSIALSQVPWKLNRPLTVMHACPFRWGWFIFGCAFMVAVFASLLLDGSKAVERRDSTILSFYNSIVLSLVVLWTAYPIVWALGEGLNLISSDVEVCAHVHAVA